MFLLLLLLLLFFNSFIDFNLKAEHFIFVFLYHTYLGQRKWAFCGNEISQTCAFAGTYCYPLILRFCITHICDNVSGRFAEMFATRHKNVGFKVHCTWDSKQPEILNWP